MSDKPMRSPGVFERLRYLPFTIGMLVVLVVVGLLVGSHSGAISTGLRRAFGSSLQTTLDGQISRWFTSLFLTAGGWRFFASALMLALCLGWVEWTDGTRRAIGIFFASHLSTLLMIYFLQIIPLASAQLEGVELLFDARDVGPSAGYYGCLGFAVARQGHRWQYFFGTGLLLFLLARLIVSAAEIDSHPHLVIGDVAHVIAFPIGLLLGRLAKPEFLMVGGSQAKHQSLD